MRHPSFSVVTFTVCLLATAGAIVAVTRRYIPRPAENAMGSAREDFLNQARYQRIPWRELNANALSEARRTNRPILLVIGIPESALARRIDREAFGDSELAAYVARNFVAVRVDGQHQSEWPAALLPITRLRMRFMPEFQAWVLDSQGRTFDLIAVQQGRPPLRRETVFAALRRAVERHAQGFPPDQAPGLAQSLDLEGLMSASGPPLPDFQRYTEAMVGRVDANDGLAETAGFQPLQPNLYRYLGDVGRRFEMRRSLDRICLSPMMDVVGGGFYRLAAAPDLLRTTFDKQTVSNAEMAAALAHAAAIFGDEGYAEAARLALRALDEDVGLDRGIAAGIIGDEDRAMRSRTDSLSLAFVREQFDAEERGFLLNDLNVGRSDNRQRVPYVTDLRRLFDPRMPRIRERLRELRPVNPDAVIRSRLLHIEAYAVARMFEAARILGDQHSLARAEARRIALEDFRDGAILRNDADQPGEAANFLGYLAFADAMLHSYLATGNAVDFELGMATLRQARELYRLEDTELYAVANRPSERLTLVDARAPQIADDSHESATATFIRLAHAYGRLSEDPIWTGYAFRAMEQVTAAIAGLPSPKLAGYYRASASLRDGRIFATVGADAVELASRLAKRQPSRIVAPAVGPALASLKGRAPGIYVIEGGRASGPYTFDEASRRFGIHLESGS